MATKAAQERAVAVWMTLPRSVQTNLDLSFNAGGQANMPGVGRRAFLDALELAFKENARDQRHACAENVSVWMADREHYESAINDAHSAAMNAPEPGKENTR